ncbi:NTPase [Algoriphagus sp. AK58]|uniref:NTPase n=1 Tax=Algoriphagus sp. AK58 TaxID=1406877 RepID=UPI00164F320D|nr:NTPase [Algoriphagus sp. AK58]MBC6365544.1 NTPase [Algoriphagus sp. AK58]
MKYILFFLFFIGLAGISLGQGGLPPSFFEGKSVVVISTDPGARPVLSWQELADSVHTYLVQAGADPIAYFELEQVALSEARQADYAKAFLQRQVKNVILVTRQKEKLSIHVGPFSGDGKIIASPALFGVSGKDWIEAGGLLQELGKTTKSKNLLVLDVAEFPQISSQETAQSVQKFIPRNPLNLEVFKLGIPLEGSSAETGAMSYFRYDLFGKSEATILAEQATQKTQIQGILESLYPYQIEWLTEAKTTQQLIADRVQFILVKVEGRQADLMKSMGLEPLTGEDGSKTVVKYYIRFLVRDELYIGPDWDANPDWREALTRFLENLKK